MKLGGPQMGEEDISRAVENVVAQRGVVVVATGRNKLAQQEPAPMPKDADWNTGLWEQAASALSHGKMMNHGEWTVQSSAPHFQLLDESAGQREVAVATVRAAQD